MVRSVLRPLTIRVDLGQTSAQSLMACHLRIARDSSKGVASRKRSSGWRATYHVCDCRILHQPLHPAVGHHLLGHLHHHRVVQHTSKAPCSSFPSFSSWTATHAPEHVSHSTEVHSARFCSRLGSSCGCGIARWLGLFRPCFRICERRSQAGISWLDIETALE